VSRKLALIIGNSVYEDKDLARLTAPQVDVKALAEVLRDPTIGSFDEVSSIIDESVTVVRRAIARFFADKKRDDLLLLYFSGHGVLDDQGRLYLALRDTERDLLSGTAMPARFITEEMDRSYSQSQVLVLDCCQSGAFARGTKGTTGASVGTASVFEGTGSGRVVLTASDATQYAWEGNRVTGQAEHSVFTHHLVQGLKSGDADLDFDGHVTLDELYDYVHGHVVRETPKQTPGKWSYKQQGEIVIAQNPHPPRPVALPHELEDAINSRFVQVREDAVKELERLFQSSHRGLALAAQQALQHLTEDDSRRVSALAAEVLAAHIRELVPQQSDIQRASAAQAEAQRLEAEAARKRAEEAEEERLRAGQLSSFYAEAIGAFEAENWEVAVSAFNRVLEIEPNYRDAFARLQQAETRIQDGLERRREVQEKLADLESKGRIPDFIVSRATQIVALDKRQLSGTATDYYELLDLLAGGGVSVGEFIDRWYRIRDEELGAPVHEPTAPPQIQSAQPSEAEVGPAASVQVPATIPEAIKAAPPPISVEAPSASIFKGITPCWARADIPPMDGEFQVLSHYGLNLGPRKAGDVMGELLGTTRSMVLTNRRILLTRVNLPGAFSKSSRGELFIEIPLEHLEDVHTTLRGFSATFWMWLPFSIIIWLMTRRLELTYRDRGDLRRVRIHVPKASKWMTEIESAAHEQHPTATI
jgi:tetratricopeptide (TPR) repeat protein